MSHAVDAVLGLLAQRKAGATICPSEAARRIAPPGTDWRAQMAVVHEGVDRLLIEKRVQLSWQGRTLQERAGPYRIAAR